MLLTGDLKIDFIVIVFTITVIVRSYFKSSFRYWKRRGLRTPPPSFPFGNMTDLFLARKTIGEIFRDIYFYFKSRGLKHGGAYIATKPFYVTVDLDIVKCVLQNNFQYFTGHGMFSDEDLDPLSLNLVALDGPKWRSIRNKFTPAFTTGKIKMMLSTLVDYSEKFNALLENFSKQGVPVNLKDVAARFSTDVIGFVQFGVDCNSMKDPNAEFRKYGSITVDMGILGTIRQFGQIWIPHWILRLFKIAPNNPLVTNFFTSFVKGMVTFREKNNITRQDFLHFLLHLKDRGMLTKGDVAGDVTPDENDKKDTITLNEIMSQCFMFYIAGFEPPSAAINFAAYELALNLDIQGKLREEINTVLKRHDNKMSYEAIAEMSYLEKVICETLRKYPFIPELLRICNEDFKVPGSDVIIEKGTLVIIPVLGIHYDPEHFPEPEKFDPERFSEENKPKRHHYSFLTFGEGPRICLGMRFGKLLTKIGIITLLKNYSITLNKKTQTPLIFKKTGVSHVTKQDIWTNLYKI